MISSTKSAASLSDYSNFHGMFCRPATASRCVDSFAGGTILFMPSSYTEKTLPSYDCSAKGVLTPLSYYMLVLYSLTGLSTLLRLTVFRMAREFPAETKADPSLMTSKYNSLLRVEPFVLEHCKRHTNAQSIHLKRRFEYKFKLVGLEVVMLHFFCDQNKLHLVEVFHFNNWIVRNWVAPCLLKFGKVFRSFVHRRRKKKLE